MITILLIMSYVGGVIGVIKSAPEGHSPGQVLISGLVWPTVIVSIWVEGFIRNHATWIGKGGYPTVNK